MSELREFQIQDSEVVQAWAKDPEGFIEEVRKRGGVLNVEREQAIADIKEALSAVEGAVSKVKTVLDKDFISPPPIQFDLAIGGEAPEDNGEGS